MNWKVGWGVALSLACVCAGPKLVITEIMYDPSSSESDEKQTEWVEISNLGPSPANLQGMLLTSGTKSSPRSDRQKFVLPAVAVAPGECVVIGIGSSGSYAGLELPLIAAHCGETKYAWLTNTGDSVALRDAKGNVIDEVIYAVDSPWPVGDRGGASIQFVAPPGEDPVKANDDGKNWVQSVGGNSDEFKDHGRGTPRKPTPTGTASTTKPSNATTKPARGKR